MLQSNHWTTNLNGNPRLEQPKMFGVIFRLKF
jgi:hypothetical protein